MFYIVTWNKRLTTDFTDFKFSVSMQKSLQGGEHHGQVILKGIPQQVLIYRKVDMYKTVAHCAHQRPWDLWICFHYVVRNLICGFADNNEIQLDGLQGFAIGAEGIKIHAPREGLNLGNRIQDILNSFSPVPMRHGYILPAPAHECAA